MTMEEAVAPAHRQRGCCQVPDSMVPTTYHIPCLNSCFISIVAIHHPSVTAKLTAKEPYIETLGIIEQS